MLDAKAEYLIYITTMGWNILRRKEKRNSKAYKESNIVRNLDKVGRNDVCPCGSGKKYKKCCGK